MDYNTQREKLLMPEYGRHIQKMIEQVKAIKDRDKRNEQIKAVVTIMGILNPQLRDVNDFKHKLWDHVQVISNFDIDIDSPYSIPTKESFVLKPERIPLETKPIKATHYGRNIQNMIDIIANREEDEMKDLMIKSLASYMRQQYLIWNKDSVSEETIFNDIRKLSEGRLIVPDHIHLDTISDKEVFNRPGIMGNNNGQPRNNSSFKKNNKGNKKRWKNNNNGKQG